MVAQQVADDRQQPGVEAAAAEAAPGQGSAEQTDADRSRRAGETGKAVPHSHGGQQGDSRVAKALWAEAVDESVLQVDVEGDSGGHRARLRRDHPRAELSLLRGR